jgi:hypothetical protein
MIIGHDHNSPLPILTNRTPPTSPPYQPLVLHVNVGPKLYTFSNLFDHAHVGLFSFSILLTLPITHDQDVQLTFISSTRLQLSPKVLCFTPIY